LTHIITGLCLRSGRCVEYCPVDCIAPGQPMDVWPHYYIDPQVCIDCGLCVAACPYHAIWPQEEVPLELQADIQPNYDFYNPR
jgi:ferredoxin